MQNEREKSTLQNHIDPNNIRIRMKFKSEAGTVFKNYTVLRFENEDSTHWYFTLRDEDTGLEKWWGFARKEFKGQKPSIDEDGKKKMVDVYIEKEPPYFLDILRNRAVIEGRYKPWEEE